MKKLLSLTLVALLLLAGHVQADSMRDLKRELGQALRTKNANQVASVLEKIANQDSRDAVKFLLTVGIKSDYLKLSDVGTAKVFEAVVRGLKNVRNSKAVDYMIDKCESRSSRYWQRNIILIKSLQGRSGKEARQAIAKNLKHRRQEVVMAALAAVKKDKNTDAVDELIDLVDRFDKRQNLIWIESRRALLAITGQDLDTASDWRKWWSTVKNNFTPGSSGSGQTILRKRKKGPSLFGTEVHSKRVVFVIDVSGSMQMKDPETSEGGGTYSPRGGMGGGQANIPEHRKRILRAKNELIKVVKALDRDVRFNIIAYSNIIKVWKPKHLQNATRGNKASAIKFVQGFQASGATWTKSAMKKGFEFKEANTIYLLSDGSPTPETSMPVPGKPQPAGGGMGGMAGLTDAICAMVKNLNKFRSVKVYTLGFRGANVPFMKKLAEENGGKYSDIR